MFGKSDRDRMHPTPEETANATRMEANRRHLRQIDPDAARILATDCEAGQLSWKVNKRLTAEMDAYATAKHKQGRMDLYSALFAGVTD